MISIDKNNKKLNDFLDSQFYKKELYWQYKFEVNRGNEQYWLNQMFRGRHKSANTILFLTYITKVDNFIIKNLCKDNDIDIKWYNEVSITDYIE